MTPDEVKVIKAGRGVGVSGWERFDCIRVSEVGRILKAAMRSERVLDEHYEAWLSKAEELEAMK